MAMRGLGRPTEIWGWPFHLFVAVRAEYLKSINPPPPVDENKDVTEIAPGITMETTNR